MIELIFGDHSEDLACALATKTEMHKKSVLSESIVSLSDPSLKPYLLYDMAQKNGVATGYQFTTIESIFRTFLENDQEETTCLSVTQMAFKIHETFLTEEKMIPHSLRRLVEKLKSNHHDSQNSELAEFSFRCAGLFNTLSHDEPSWLISPPEEKAQSWQLAFYRQLLKEALDSAKKSPGFLTLPLLLAKGSKPNTLDQTFHVFGAEQLSPGVLFGLQKLSALKNAHFIVYAENPCREYWEDIVFSETPENVLLTKWGNRIRTTVSNVSNIVGHDHEWLEPSSGSHNTPNATVLRTLQEATKNRSLPLAPSKSPTKTDTSLVFLTAPDRRREIEETAKQINHALLTNPKLCLDDLALFCPPDAFENYADQIPAVFLEFGDFQFTINNANLARRSPVADFFKSCLLLPDSAHKRRDVFNILFHKNLNTPATPENKSEWVALIDALSIYKGRDKESNVGTYKPKNVFHWQQGVDSILPKIVYSKDKLRSGDTLHSKPTPNPQPFSSDKNKSALLLACVVRTLLADSKQAGQQQLTPKGWATWWLDFFNDYCVPHTPSEINDFKKIIDLLSSLKEAHKSSKTLTLKEFRTLLLKRVDALKRSPNPSHGAITIAPLSCNNGRVFRHSFIMGLNASLFPKSLTLSPWDPRDGSKHAGLQRGASLQALLNILMQTKDKLVLSHPTTDSENGHPLNRSAVFEDLERASRDFGVAPTYANASPNRHNRLSDPEKFELNIDPLDQKITALAKNTVEIPQVKESKPQQTPPLEPIEKEERLTIQDILRFLDFPHQGWSKTVLKLATPSVLGHYENDAPLTWNLFKKDGLLKTALFQMFQENASPQHIASDFISHAFEGKNQPTGLFADIEKSKFETLLHAWHSLSAASTETMTSVAFGSHTDSHPVSTTLPALALQNNRVYLRARPFFVKNEKTLATFLTKDKISKKDLLHGFLNGLALKLEGSHHIEELEFITPLKKKNHSLSLPTRNESRHYLESVIGSLFHKPHEYFLTFEAAIEIIKKSPSQPHTVLGKHRSQFKRNAHFFPRQFAGELPDPQDLQDTINTLYKPLFDWVKF